MKTFEEFCGSDCTFTTEAVYKPERETEEKVTQEA